MRTLSTRCSSLLLALLMLLPASLAAQTLTGSISGVIKDDQAAVLPGATVTLTGRQGTMTQVSDAEGRYRFAPLEPGAYELTAQLSGFQQYQAERDRDQRRSVPSTSISS